MFDTFMCLSTKWELREVPAFRLNEATRIIDDFVENMGPNGDDLPCLMLKSILKCKKCDSYSVLLAKKGKLIIYM